MSAFSQEQIQGVLETMEPTEEDKTAALRALRRQSQAPCPTNVDLYCALRKLGVAQVGKKVFAEAQKVMVKEDSHGSRISYWAVYKNTMPDLLDRVAPKNILNPKAIKTDASFDPDKCWVLEKGCGIPEWELGPDFEASPNIF